MKKNAPQPIKIYDRIRKKFVLMQPEEKIRQRVITFLVNGMGFSPHHICVESSLPTKTKKRIDILVFNKNIQPVILIECKASDKLTLEHLHQLMDYNRKIQAPYICLTNGNSFLISRVSQHAFTILDSFIPVQHYYFTEHHIS